MTIHYRFTDTKGRTHTRTSRREIEPQYTHGLVAYLNGRCEISFHRNKANAENAAARWHRASLAWITEICPVEASATRFPEQVERDRATARRVARVKRADLAQLRSDEESERRGLAMMSGDLEG